MEGKVSLANGDSSNDNGIVVESEENTPSSEPGNQAQPEPEEGPQREITQTDHLNKRLLNSFLDRLNQQNFGNPLFGKPNDLEEEEQEQDFSDSTGGNIPDSSAVVPAKYQ